MQLVLLGVNQKILSAIDSRFQHQVVGTLEELFAELGRRPAVIVIQPSPEQNAAELAARIRATSPELPLLFVGDEWEIGEAVRLGQLGVFHLLTTTSSAEELNSWIQRAVDCLPSQTKESEAGPSRPWKQFLVGESWPMRVLGEVIRLVAPRRTTVLITGETGTGKEMVARALHACSPRADMPMVSINCSALPAELLEAELFGYVRGAFTGAFANRQGRIEKAHRGTLFLDEIGEMPLNLQAKLLRVLQEREFQPLGSSETIRVDVRVIAATNANLEEMVRKGKFREDLYYRINVAPIFLTPLRNRASDIPLLARFFVERTCRQEGLAPKIISPEAMNWLLSQQWPGNVRQLENAVEVAVALSGNRTVLTLADFGALMAPKCEVGMFVLPEEGLDYNFVVDQFERNILERALQLSAGSKKKAAELLRLKRTTFAAKLKSLRIETSEADPDEESGAVWALEATV